MWGISPHIHKTEEKRNMHRIERHIQEKCSFGKLPCNAREKLGHKRSRCEMKDQICEIYKTDSHFANAWRKAKIKCLKSGEMGHYRGNCGL